MGRLVRTHPIQEPAAFASGVSSNPLAAANAPMANAARTAYSGHGTAGGFDYAATGAQVYATNCAACHGASGAGVPGAFPALAADPIVTNADPQFQIAIVLHGLHGKIINRSSYSAQMPAFSQLSDSDIAAIIDHERTSWGNAAPTINPDDIKRARGAENR